jgi:hypothetical protein
MYWLHSSSMNLRTRVTASDPEMNIWLRYILKLTASQAGGTPAGTAWGAYNLMESYRRQSSYLKWWEEDTFVPCLPTRHFPKYVSAHSIAHKNPNDYTIFSEDVTIIYIRIPQFTCNLNTVWKFKGRRHSTKNSAESGYHNIPDIHQWTIWELLRINIHPYARPSIHPTLRLSNGAWQKRKGRIYEMFLLQREPRGICFVFTWMDWSPGQNLSHYSLHKKSTGTEPALSKQPSLCYTVITATNQFILAYDARYFQFHLF